MFISERLDQMDQVGVLHLLWGQDVPLVQLLHCSCSGEKYITITFVLKKKKPKCSMLLTQTCSPRRKARSWRCSSAPAVCLWVWHWTAASVVWRVKSQGFPPGLWWSRCSPVPTVGRLHLKSERQTQGNIKAVFFKLFWSIPHHPPFEQVEILRLHRPLLLQNKILTNYISKGLN